MNNKIELLGWYGGDEAIACSAWTSTNRDLTPEKRERIPSLLKQLWSAEPVPHGSPFEKGIVHFLVDTDIASHIHLLKHRISSINAECITGDTKITFVNTNNVASAKLAKTVKELYDSWNNGRKHQNTEADKLYNQKRIKNMKLRVLDEKTGLFTTSHIKDVWYKGKQDIYQITLCNGKKIKCTDNHFIWTKDGYKTISNGLSLNSLVGCNGISIEVPNKPWTFESFYSESLNYTRKEFAIKYNLKYELVKKWGYIFDISFKKDENKDFKKGLQPWNKNITGYKINIKKRKHNPLKGDKSHFWRGGISSERELIGTWATQNAFKVHQKYNFTCQKCGLSSKNLHAHHIIPVTADITKAYDFENLITVCKNCHYKIHETVESEIEFAKEVLSQNYEIKIIDWYNNPKRLKGKLAVHYSPIIDISFLGKEDTYDIEVEGNNNNFIANGIVVHNSARYKELKEDKFYLPEDWNEIYPSGDGFKLGLDWKEILEDYTIQGNILYHQCLEDLTPILGRKRAKESARFFKTYNSQIQADILFNMRSFHNFLTQRMDEYAQLEIRIIAKEMLELVKNIEGNPFKYTLEAWSF